MLGHCFAPVLDVFLGSLGRCLDQLDFALDLLARFAGYFTMGDCTFNLFISWCTRLRSGSWEFLRSVFLDKTLLQQLF